MMAQGASFCAPCPIREVESREAHALLEAVGGDAKSAEFWERLEVQCQAEAQTLLEPSLDSIWEMLREGEEMMQLAQATPNVVKSTESTKFTDSEMEREASEEVLPSSIEQAERPKTPDVGRLGGTSSFLWSKPELLNSAGLPGCIPIRGVFVAASLAAGVSAAKAMFARC
ncbi:unnamed protein product [Durusdinium trenchii]|uniref:Uncharacterized protein n=1 Tax=Durusdinium trenchii TaxID=1381693 RepID=A0ABP0MHY3_9DINO